MSPVLLAALWLMFVMSCFFFTGYREKKDEKN